MSLPQSTVVAFMGAAVLGVVGAAAVYVVEHFRQEKRRHALVKDVARLDSELANVRRELDKLLKLQRDKSEKVSKPRRVRKTTQTNSIVPSTADDFMSLRGDIDSSDLEFYDVSDEEIDGINSTAEFLEIRLIDIDKHVDSGLDLGECLEKLEDLNLEYPENPELLWRLGKLHQKISDQLENDDKSVHIEKGIEACQAALNLNSQLPNAHKWIAILIGSRSDLQPTKERIQDGQLFKKHVDAAIAINPKDPSLHHMMGRFCYEVSGLKWYERKVAAAFYAEPPEGSYDEALTYFLEAEKLSNFGWKENQLFIAKCYIALANTKEALVWLDKAKIKQGDSLDSKIDIEIKSLLEKYSSSR